ncbi:MAG: hypothetical protein WCF84_13120 [Anaerolineae bacterium]
MTCTLAALAAKHSSKIGPNTLNNTSCLTLNQNLQPTTPTTTAPTLPEENAPDTNASTNWLQNLWDALVGWLAPAPTVAQNRGEALARPIDGGRPGRRLRRMGAELDTCSMKPPAWRRGKDAAGDATWDAFWI